MSTSNPPLATLYAGSVTASSAGFLTTGDLIIALVYGFVGALGALGFRLLSVYVQEKYRQHLRK